MSDVNAFFGFTDLPFAKMIETGKEFESEALRRLKFRLNFLLSHKGIGLVSGRPGTGKTTFVRNFVSNLNPGIYKVVYLHRSNLSPVEFYRELAYELGLTPKIRRCDLCRQISVCIAELYQAKRQIPILIIDEAQLLRREILAELLLLTNYEMDSRDYMVMLLVGQSAFETTLSLTDNEALMQRIVVRTNMDLMTKDETRAYIQAHLKRVGCKQEIFSKSAIEAIYQTGKGIMRKTNRVATLGLQMAMEAKATTVTNTHVVDGVTEHGLL